MKKEFIKNNNLTGMVRELVEGLGRTIEAAHRYDLKKEEFEAL